MKNELPSFEKINYSIRPNKSIERKIIIEVLQALASLYNTSAYQYVGFGSMWFTDFNLIHRILKIKSMISIEKPGRGFRRANFNKPFSCIEVIEGQSKDILPELEWKKRRSIVWLDYDKGIDGDVIEDTEVVCQNAQSGSLVIVTLDANLESSRLLVKDDSGTMLSRVDMVEYFAGPFVDWAEDKKYLNKSGFPTIVGRILYRLLLNKTRKGRINFEFIPFFNFHYSDGTPMVTVGGMVANRVEGERYRKLNPLKGMAILEGRNETKIKVPLLTQKEKIEFDRRLPQGYKGFAKGIGRRFHSAFSEEDLEEYFKYYRHYPIYGEIHF